MPRVKEGAARIVTSRFREPPRSVSFRDWAIRDARPTELDAIVDLQKTIWAYADRDLVPVRTLQVLQRIGGNVLVAVRRGVAEGFLVDFPAVVGHLPAAYSSMLGVLPGLRGRGIGEALKWMQHDRAAARGLPLVFWLFDPLEPANTRLNVGKLGAVARTYRRNILLPTSSARHSGLGTDRLVAEWWIGGPRVRARRSGRDRSFARAPVILESRRRRDGSCWPDRTCAPGASDFVRIDVPPSIHEMKAAFPAAARAWRLAMREALEKAFARGFVLDSLVRNGRGKEARPQHLLARAEILAAEGVPPRPEGL